MKENHKRQSIKRLCRLFGYSSQNYYKRRKYSIKKLLKEEKIISLVKEERCEQPKLGTQKLHYLLNKTHPEIKIGRDALYNLLRKRGLLIKKVNKYRPRKTNGDGVSIYPDYRKGIEIERVNQLWCVDITYMELKKSVNHLYLTLITDEASHLIVGYELSRRMQTKDVLKALERARIEQLQKGDTFNKGLIIHSDRGSQFKSQEFKEYTDEFEIIRSMCGAGKSHENPVAERINGILKHELLTDHRFNDVIDAKKKISKAITIYNRKRPHLSCDMLTPQEAHDKNQWPLKKRWRQRKKRSKLELTTKISRI